MFLSYRYRVYPLHHQLPILVRHLEELTFLWNHALAERRDAWDKEGHSVTYLDQQRKLKVWRAFDRTGVGTVPYDVSRDLLQRLDLAFQSFFRRVRRGKTPGYPKFRRETRSFTFTPHKDPWCNGPAGTIRLKLPAVGAIPVRRHRPPPQGSAKTVTIRREGASWFATLQYVLPDPPSPTGEPRRFVGVDLGLTHLATVSTGETVETPRFFRAGERKLCREQRRLARKKKGSHRYQKQRERVARCHRRIRRQRGWFAHQLSKEWAERFDLIAFEDLSVSSMVRNGHLSKSISDAGWGMLQQLCVYKQILRSHRYVEVPARYTSQICSECGHVADPPLALSAKIYRCPCGYEADRDVNAARNILKRGLLEVRRNTAELKRVDGKPPPTRQGRRAYQGKREPTIAGPEAMETSLPSWIHVLPDS